MQAYTWLFTLSAVLHAMVSAVMLVIVWIGWRRQRHLGFLLLVGWAIVSTFSALSQWLLTPLVQNLLRKAAPSASNNYGVLVLPSLLAGWVSTLFLVAGLALLVFRAPPDAPAGPSHSA